MPEQLRFTDEQKKAYRAAYAPNATDQQAALFFAECERRALLPGVHVVFQLRKASEFSAQLQRTIDVQKVTLITTINALRLIAERSGKFRGYGKFAYYYTDNDGAPTINSVIPLGRIPHAASVELFREGWAQPVFSVARYDACVQLKSDKTPTSMWFKRGEEQLAKCAEANGLRMVAPEECGGLYIEEEMGQAENEQSKADVAATSNTIPAEVAAIIPQATVAPAVNQAPAPIQTSYFKEVAESSAKVWETPAPPTPKPAPSVPRPPAAAKAAPPAPSRPVTQPPAPATVAAPAPTPAAAGPIPNRVPIVQEPAQESPTELAEFADRVARDTTPAPAPAKFVATDDDLPENLQPPKTDPLAKSPGGGTAAAAALLAPAPNVAHKPADVAHTEPNVAHTAPTGEQAANATEYQSFMNRAAKIVRDKLEKEAKVKNAGAAVKDYLLKKSGQAKLNKISAAVFEEIISALEKATPQEAAEIVKG